jgi:hypothetical protein
VCAAADSRQSWAGPTEEERGAVGTRDSPAEWRTDVGGRAAGWLAEPVEEAGRRAARGRSRSRSRSGVILPNRAEDVDAAGGDAAAAEDAGDGDCAERRIARQGKGRGSEEWIGRRRKRRGTSWTLVEG